MSARKSIIPLLAAVMACGCNIDISGLTGPSYDLDCTPMSDGYFVGDTVTFVSQEWVRQPFNDGRDQQIQPSDKAPTLYTWTSSLPAAAEFIAPGRLVLKTTGRVPVRVATSRATLIFTVSILPHGVRMLVTPHQVTLNVGGSATLHADIVDSLGRVIPDAMSGDHWYSTSPSPYASVTQRILSEPDYQVKGVSPGQVVVSSRFSVYRGGTLIDSTVVIVH
jgi:hypothetical protein